jgi:hypothetical protein
VILGVTKAKVNFFVCLSRLLTDCDRTWYTVSIITIYKLFPKVQAFKLVAGKMLCSCVCFSIGFFHRVHLFRYNFFLKITGQKYINIFVNDFDIISPTQTNILFKLILLSYETLKHFITSYIFMVKGC